jgi:hypothetical protein
MKAALPLPYGVVPRRGRRSVTQDSTFQTRMTMWDVYRSHKNQHRQLIIKQGAEVPSNYDKADWSYAGSKPQIARDMAEQVERLGFVELINPME